MQCEIARRFFEMLTAISAEQKVPRAYSGGGILHQAEISLLEKIDEYPASNISVLSQKSGVTKSAVTQMSMRLLDKGLIERYQSPGNKKEKYFRLTEAGRAARREYAEYNRAAAEEMRNYLCSLNETDKKAILKFMDMMTKYMPVHTFPCQCGAQGRPCYPAIEEKGAEDPCWN